MNKKKNAPFSSAVGGKRKVAPDAAGGGGGSGGVAKKTRTEMGAYMESVKATPLVEANSEQFVHDSCSEVIKKIKEFCSRDGVTKGASFPNDGWMDLFLGWRRLCFVAFIIVFH